MVCVDELETEIRRGRRVGGHAAEVGEEGGGESDGVDADFPASGVGADDGVGGRGEEGVADELVAEAGAEDFEVGAGGVCFFWGC